MLLAAALQSPLLLTLASITSALHQVGNPFQVPAPWTISDLSISNIRHGTGGTWRLNILDNYTLPPQGFNSTCYYYSNNYYFAQDSAPYNAPCANPNITFGLFPQDGGFVLNITHLWGNCGTASDSKPKPCIDNGTWHFSHDDVSGQEIDAENNFGQAGSFYRNFLRMYPTRAVASTKCEFC